VRGHGQAYYAQPSPPYAFQPARAHPMLPPPVPVQWRGPPPPLLNGGQHGAQGQQPSPHGGQQPASHGGQPSPRDGQLPSNGGSHVHGGQPAHGGPPSLHGGLHSAQPHGVRPLLNGGHPHPYGYGRPPTSR
jgi:hypothetical protein